MWEMKDILGVKFLKYIWISTIAENAHVRFKANNKTLWKWSIYWKHLLKVFIEICINISIRLGRRENTQKCAEATVVMEK